MDPKISIKLVTHFKIKFNQHNLIKIEHKEINNY
jgi:hypothetical protein